MSDQDLTNWSACPSPPDDLELEGQYVRLERFDASRHAGPIHARAADHPQIWEFMLGGPYDAAEAYGAAVEALDQAANMMFFAIFDKDLGDFAGHCSYLRINPAHGSIELGNIALTPSMQRSRAATEAWVLMMGWAFDAGYRRFEWKCNALNQASRRAAVRLGFQFEGVHRQAMVIKGKNRDTAWYSILDTEWPNVNAAFRHWLAPGNFGADGQQLKRLSDFR